MHAKLLVNAFFFLSDSAQLGTRRSRRHNAHVKASQIVHDSPPPADAHDDDHSLAAESVARCPLAFTQSAWESRTLRWHDVVLEQPHRRAVTREQRCALPREKGVSAVTGPNGCTCCSKSLLPRSSA